MNRTTAIKSTDNNDHNKAKKGFTNPNYEQIRWQLQVITEELMEDLAEKERLKEAL